MDNETSQAQPGNAQNLQPEAEKITILPEAHSKQIKKGEAIKKFIKDNLRIVIIIAVIVVVGILAYFFRGLVIAATVDGSPISRLAVIQKLEKESGKNLLDSLITQKLVQNAASANKLSVSDDDVNGEIKKIEDQVASMGSTMDEALSAQGMTMADLKERIVLQKELEKLLADKINVADEEIAQYIKDNNITVPTGQEAATNDQIKSEISSQKFNSEAETYIAELKAKANIQYFVNY
ncbi:MAG: SurA N-terminal domain-containing protein [Patescibacteria group bacterium]